MEIEYRNATSDDHAAICAFVDYWLTGGGKADHIQGAGHDYFVRHGQQADYLKKYTVLLALLSGEIVGWAVKTKKNVLIHLLIAATFRGQDIGSEMLRRMKPDVVRSKFDQSTGDPGPFYTKHGFVKAIPEKVGKKLNIEIYTLPGLESKAGSLTSLKKGCAAIPNTPQSKKAAETPQRTIDILAKKFADHK